LALPAPPFLANTSAQGLGRLNGTDIVHPWRLNGTDIVHPWRTYPILRTNLSKADFTDVIPPTSDLRFTSACAYIADVLPSFCTCTDTSTLGASMSCMVDVLGIDTVGVKGDFEPCANPFYMSLDVTEETFGINFPIADLSAGSDELVQIPGLSFGLPGIGSADAYMAIKIDGTVADMSIAIGVDACMTLVGFKTCGSDLTSSLPIYILKNTLHFQGLCGGGSYSTYSEPTYDTYDTYSAPTYDTYSASTYGTYSGGTPPKIDRPSA